MQQRLRTVTERSPNGDRRRKENIIIRREKKRKQRAPRAFLGCSESSGARAEASAADSGEAKPNSSSQPIDDDDEHIEPKERLLRKFARHFPAKDNTKLLGLVLKELSGRISLADFVKVYDVHTFPAGIVNPAGHLIRLARDGRKAAPIRISDHDEQVCNCDRGRTASGGYCHCRTGQERQGPDRLILEMEHKKTEKLGAMDSEMIQ